jgi:hypothetical protein
MRFRNEPLLKREKGGGTLSLSGIPKQNLTASRALVHAHGLVGDDPLAKVLP